MFYVNDNKYGDDIAIAHEYMYDGSRDYYIGNCVGSKIGDLVYYRDEEGFWVRNLLDNVDTPIDFLNEMNIASKTAVGFLNSYIIVENKSYNYPDAEIYDLY